MRLTTNLATRVYIDMRKVNFLIAGAMALLLILLSVIVAGIVEDLGTIHRLNKGIAALEGKSAKGGGSAVSDRDYQDLLARIRFANGIIEKKAFDWLTLFNMLENVVPDGIALSAIEPDPKERGLKIGGLAKGFGNIRKLMENLEDSKFFTDVYLVSQSATQVSQNENGISFQITCKAAYK